MKLSGKWKKFLPLILFLWVILIAGFWYFSSSLHSKSGQSGTKKDDFPEKFVQVGENEEIQDGVHKSTGLIADEGLNLVIAHCTGCHSPKLITQNRADRQGWLEVIRWMQKTQNLWDLGDQEEAILTYLAKNYAPERKGRRAPIMDIEWYELKE